MTDKELKDILDQHKVWLSDSSKGNRADLSRVDLSGADLSRADLRGANLYGANLSRANLSEADLSEAYLSGADLSRADLREAILSGANLNRANLSGANLSGADLLNAKHLLKTMGVEQGNIYWKRIDYNLINEGYQFKLGLNKLRKCEVFASDERILCSYPGFHFASRSWCAVYYPNRPYEVKIRIPLKAKINEPWATDGKASADMIEILEIYDSKTGKNITNQFRKTNVKKSTKKTKTIK